MDKIYQLRDFLRMDESVLSEILSKIESRITQHSISPSIPADVRLLKTLSFQAEGTSYHQLRWDFRVSYNAICGIVLEKCLAIRDVFGPKYLETSNTSNQWRARGFGQNWNFEGCLGTIQCPAQ